MKSLKIHFVKAFLAFFLGFNLIFFQRVHFSHAQGVIDLKTAIEIALKKNLKLAQKALEKEAKVYLSKAAYKDMLPSIDTNYSYTGRRDAASIVVFGHSTTIYGHETYKLNVNLKQPIFRGGLLWNRFKAAQIDVDIAKMSEFQAKNEIIRDVKNAYYEILKNEKLLDEARASLKRLKSQYEMVKSFFEASLRPKTDLLQSTVKLKQGELELIKTRHALEISKNRLNLLLRMPLDSPLKLKEEFRPLIVKLPLQKLYELALSKRPEIKEVRLSIEKAEREVKIAQSEFFPRIDLTATYAKEGVTPDVSNNPYGDHENAQIFINATWELFSWGKRRDKVIASQKRLSALRQELKDMEDNIRLQVKNAYLLYEDAQKGISVSRSALKSAEEDYKLNLERYRNQLATITDTLNAQERLTKARSEYFSSIALELTAISNLEYAIGEEIGHVPDKED